MYVYLSKSNELWSKYWRNLVQAEVCLLNVWIRSSFRKLSGWRWPRRGFMYMILCYESVGVRFNEETFQLTSIRLSFHGGVEMSQFDIKPDKWNYFRGRMKMRDYLNGGMVLGWLVGQKLVHFK